MSATERVDRAVFERERAAGWPNMHPEDFCHLCGGRNVVWWVDSDRWNLAVEALDRGVLEILCPTCFVILWQESTGLTATWRLVPETIRATDARAVRPAIPEEDSGV